MRLTVVGCAGSYPNGQSAASSYLLEHDGFALVIDMGSGALGPMHNYCEPARIDAVLLSHLHADHFLDMCPLFVARRYRPEGLPPRLPVYGPGNTCERLQSAYGDDHEPMLSQVFDVAAFPADEFSVGPFTVQVAQVDHPVECYGMRISAGGRTLAYSGDTAACDALVELAAGADVALFEASFRDGEDNPAGLHMTATDAARMARQAGAGRLVLTHMVAWHDNSEAADLAAAEFPGEVVVAQPGLQLDI